MIDTSHIVTGVLFPNSILGLIRDVTSLAELKVTLCVMGYDGQIGIDSAALTFSDIVERTGMSKPSVSDGLKKALDRETILYLDLNGNRLYRPSERGKENSLPHDHEHESINYSWGLKSITDKDHEHGENSLPRQKVLLTLLNEFYLEASPRVARDIALTPKYSLARLIEQVRYTRWEVKRGIDSNPQNKIKNIPGYFINRVRQNKRPPVSFDLEAALIEDEGWDQADLYEAVFQGELDMPEISQSFSFHAWLATGRRTDDTEGG